jgi:hypothetical protein
VPNRSFQLVQQISAAFVVYQAQVVFLEGCQSSHIVWSDRIEPGFQDVLQTGLAQQKVGYSLSVEIFGNPFCIMIFIGQVLEFVKEGIGPAVTLTVVAARLPQE